jgi:cobyrinic acid a,c-diamide synthase
MALIIAGERSGVGKTTITLALLAYLKSQGKSLQSFKVGPDYIDPMFHSAITGKSCRNLDPILTSEAYVKWCFNYYAQSSQLSIIEGVMGLFDGIPYHNLPYYASTAHIAKLLDLPVILIIDCSRLSISVGAIASGYANLDRQVKIVGVILNKVASEKHLTLLQAGLEHLDISIVGVWFRDEQIKIPSRHLGLIPNEEINEHQQIFEQLAQQAKDNLRWDLLFPYLVNNPTPKINYFFQSNRQYNLRIAIAKDKSFNFYYQDNLDILEYLGVKLIPFSPIQDQTLPEQIDALYLGGGFPEVFASQLAENLALKTTLKQAINNGLPTYAECGGMMYLSESITDFQGQEWQMLGILPNKTQMSKKLTIGYRQAQILVKNKFISEKIFLQGHEFHHAVNSQTPNLPLINLQDFLTQTQLSPQGWQVKNVYASYLHLHFASIIPLVEKFLQACSTRKKD